MLNLIRLWEFSVLCSLAGSVSTPVCSDHVRPQSASQLLRCWQISGAVPVVQSQGRGELQSAFTLKTITFVTIIYLLSVFFTSPGAKQHRSRPDDKPGLAQRLWILHLQSQLWRCFWIQPVGSGGCPERWHVMWYRITISHFFAPPCTSSNESDDTCDVPRPPGQSYHSPEGRLKLVIQPKSQRLNVGESLQLECGAVGRPIPRYQWHRNGVPLPNATKRKLVVRRLLFLFFDDICEEPAINDSHKPHPHLETKFPQKGPKPGFNFRVCLFLV